MKETKQNYLILAGVLAIAAVVRFLGINWGMPLKYAHIDESVVIFYSFRFLGGNLNPQVFFDYPTLFLYLIFGAMYIYFLGGRVTGAFESLDAFAGKYFSGDIADIYIIARCISAFFAVASIYLVYRVARLYFSFRVSIIAAVLAAFSWLHILHSHYATTDCAALCVTLLCVYFIIKYFRDGRRNDFLLACMTLGLAIATKYYSFIYGLILFIAVPVLRKEKINKNMLIMYGAGILVVIGGFFIGCPYAFLDFNAFYTRVSEIYINVVGPEAAFSLAGRIYAVTKGMIHGMGSIAVVAFAASIPFFFKKRSDTLYGLFFLIYVLFMLGWSLIAPRYLFPLYPFIAIIAARGIDMAAAKTNKYVLAGILVAFVISVLPKIVYTERVLLSEDTRITAYRWATENIPAGSSILRFPFTPEFKPVDNYNVKVDWNYAVLQEEYTKFNYIITSHKELEEHPARCLIKEVSGEQLGSFHNPTIYIYETN